MKNLLKKAMKDDAVGFKDGLKGKMSEIYAGKKEDLMKGAFAEETSEDKD